MTGTEERERKTGMTAFTLTDNVANNGMDLTQDIDAPAMKRHCADSCAPATSNASEDKHSLDAASASKEPDAAERDINEWGGTPSSRAGAGRVHLPCESLEFKATSKAFHRTCSEGSFEILGIEVN